MIRIIKLFQLPSITFLGLIFCHDATGANHFTVVPRRRLEQPYREGNYEMRKCLLMAMSHIVGLPFISTSNYFVLLMIYYHLLFHVQFFNRRRNNKADLEVEMPICFIWISIPRCFVSDIFIGIYKFVSIYRCSISFSAAALHFLLQGQFLLQRWDIT